MKPVRQRQIGFVHSDLEASVQELVSLPVDRLDDGRVGVAEVVHSDAARQVDVLVAVDIDDLSTVCLPHKDGMCVEQTARHQVTTSAHEVGCARPCHV